MRPQNSRSLFLRKVRGTAGQATSSEPRNSAARGQAAALPLHAALARWALPVVWQARGIQLGLKHSNHRQYADDDQQQAGC